MDVKEAKAALERGRRLIVVAPPAVEHVGVVWDLTQGRGPGVNPTGPAMLVVCADDAAAAEWADGAPADRRVHAITGLQRTAGLLAAGGIDILAGAAKDLSALVTRSVLKLDTLETLVVAWPEALLAGEHGALLDTLLADAGAARCIVLCWEPLQINDFLERHAHRAPLLGAPARDADGRPPRPVGPARFAVVAPLRRSAAVRDVLDLLHPDRPLIWRRGSALPPPPPRSGTGVTPVCADLPSREEFAELSRLGEPVLLLSAAQLPYVRSIAAPLTPLRLPSEADRARDRSEALHAQVADILETGDVDAELAVLDPLFARHDPAAVAAALLSISRRPPPAGAPAEAAEAPTPGWTKVFITVGKKDRAAAKDLVGALIREAGLVKEEIGKIDVRETFALVEVAPSAVDKAMRGLAGVTIRGRRVAARRDRT